MHTNEINFEPWRRYFEWNKTQVAELDWDDGYLLSESELKAVKASVQQFQRGESSEAKHLIKNAKRFSKETDDQTYYEALIPFIGEEHRHARDLKKFLVQQNIKPIQKHWVDQVFRGVRKRVKLEGSVFVLLTAELIAADYYPALEKATDSKVLKQICRQIIGDEDKHIAFQSALLNYYFNRNSSFKNAWQDLVWRVLLTGTIVVVWWDHARVFRAAGESFGSYWKSMWRRLETPEHCFVIALKLRSFLCLTQYQQHYE